MPAPLSPGTLFDDLVSEVVGEAKLVGLFGHPQEVVHGYAIFYDHLVIDENQNIVACFGQLAICPSDNLPRQSNGLVLVHDAFEFMLSRESFPHLEVVVECDVEKDPK